MEQPPACAGPNVLKKFLTINEVLTADERDLVWTVARPGDLPSDESQPEQRGGQRDLLRRVLIAGVKLEPAAPWGRDLSKFRGPRRSPDHRKRPSSEPTRPAR